MYLCINHYSTLSFLSILVFVCINRMWWEKLFCGDRNRNFCYARSTPIKTIPFKKFRRSQQTIFCQYVRIYHFLNRYQGYNFTKGENDTFTIYHGNTKIEMFHWQKVPREVNNNVHIKILFCHEEYSFSSYSMIIIWCESSSAI